MKLPTSLVAVKKISSDVSRSSFPAENIEKIAHLILAVEGTINPIILKRTGLESYEVVDGFLEYYAGVRAREISPLKGEMIQAIIVEPENEKTLLDQVALLRKGSNLESMPSKHDSDLEFKFANLEKIFQSQLEELRKDNRNLARAIAEVASKVQSSGVDENLIDRIVERVVEATRKTVPQSRSRKKSTDELRQNPLDLNAASAEELAAVPGIGPIMASRIVGRRQAKGNFATIEALSEVEKVSNAIIEKNQWREYFVVYDAK